MTQPVLSIENQRFQLQIMPQGGEVKSLWDKKFQCEWIWQPRDDIWDCSAIQLFPVVGRLIHGGIWQGERFYTLPDHGFLQYQRFACLERRPDKLILEARTDDATFALWPSKWRIVVSFELTDEGLIFRQQVINEDSEPLWFSIGWHPGFALPLAEQSAWKVRFANNVVNGPFFTHERTLALTEPLPQTSGFTLNNNSFEHGAIYFGNTQHQVVQVCSPEGQIAIEIDTGEHEWLALWGVPGANLLCIEPLSGTTDAPDFDGSLSHRRGIQRLEPGIGRTYSVKLSFPSGI